MKKSILIFAAVIITLSLSAFGVVNWKDLKTEESKISERKELATNNATENNRFTISKATNKETNCSSNYMPMFGPILLKYTGEEKPTGDFNYNFGPRFEAFKKSDLAEVKSIEDFFEWEELQAIASLKSVEIIIIENDRQTEKREIGYSNMLTDAQLKLLQSLDYTSHFNIRVEYLEKNKKTGKLEDSFNSPHLTIVPEKQATYSHGKDSFITYFKENSRKARKKANVDPMKMQPAKLHFIVTKNGTIENIKLDRTSNYPLVDKTMLELISKLPGTWKPAENEKGEKMDQELVVSFGLMGC